MVSGNFIRGTALILYPLGGGKKLAGEKETD